MCFFQVPPCDLGQSQYNLRIFYYNLRISYYDLRISPVSFLSECAFMRFLLDCGKSSDCGKTSDCGKLGDCGKSGFCYFPGLY